MMGNCGSHEALKGKFWKNILGIRVYYVHMRKHLIPKRKDQVGCYVLEHIFGWSCFSVLHSKILIFGAIR